MEKKQLHEALFDPSLYPPLWQPYVIFWGSMMTEVWPAMMVMPFNVAMAASQIGGTVCKPVFPDSRR